ncbi:MAG TPA: hypothetical protein VFX96_17195 [Pyrinomonadaceae bacterium]|nr:hypothetical protein [Pyrinomonadaceae bacterium]
MSEVDKGAAMSGDDATHGLLYKDAVLNHLAELANVAQFVSFGPDERQRFARVHGRTPNHSFETMGEAVEELLKAAPDNSVNVRSFTPENPKSREFVYGLKAVDDVLSNVRRLAGQGLYTIVNETVDVNDGGVSGVIFGGVLEFAPADTPRCVEKPGTASLPYQMGLRLFETVYHFSPRLSFDRAQRVEFSIHPLKRGYLHDHTIIWELEEVGDIKLEAEIGWPNRFSRHVGDKAYGLLVADALGLPVPATTVIPRGLAPFRFGQATGGGEFWIRTCPVEQVPGFFTTKRGWLDPFKLLSDEDPEGRAIASVLSQEGVEAAYSGALVADHDGALTIEGVRGFGDEFMVGRAERESLPTEVERDVRRLYEEASARVGPVRMEWVHDGERVWVVQLHRGATATSGSVIFPGDAQSFRRFNVADGIDGLRSLIAEASDAGEGIILVGNVGVTSHFGDLLRRAKIPSRIERIAS